MSDQEPGFLFVAVPLHDLVSFRNAKLTGAAEVFTAGLGIAEHDLHKAPVEEGFSEVLTQLDGFGEIFESAVVIAHLAVNNTPVVISEEKPRVYPEGGLKIAHNSIVGMLKFRRGILLPGFIPGLSYGSGVCVRRVICCAGSAAGRRMVRPINSA